MATTGVINSTLLLVKVGGTAVALCTDASLTITADIRDISTKDSSGWREILPGLKSGSISVSALHAYDAAYGVTALFAALTGQTELTLTYTTGVSGDKIYTASAYITSLEMNSPGVEESATYSATFELSSSVTETT